MQCSKMFQRLSRKTWDPTKRQKYKEDVAMTLAMMDMTFPLNFFDIMVHMPYNVLEELHICEPNQVRRMYPIKRNMQFLKKHVKNKARSEASIVHGYLFEEMQGFVSEYL